MPTLVKAPLAALLATFCAAVAFFLSFAVSGALWFNLAAAGAGFAIVMWGITRNAWIAAAGAVCIVAIALAPATIDHMSAKPPPASRDLIDRIARAAIPLRSVDPGTGFADLDPLRTTWQGARMVALGEATHGTSEFFRIKHRLTEFLVTQMGFRHFAMEIDPRVGKRIDEYIRGETANDPMRELSWPWGTREFAEMLRWMRSYNASVPKPLRIEFHGIDYQGQQRDFRMAQNVLELLDHARPSERFVLWAHNGHVAKDTGWMGSYLKRSLRNQIYLTGFEFHHGRFTSNTGWVDTYESMPADTRYYAGTLARVGRSILFLDFRAADPEVAAWLDEPHWAHDIAEAYGFFRLSPTWVATDASWSSLYDGVVYVEQSTKPGAWH